MAVVTAVAAKPFAVKYFGKETTTAAETVKIPKDLPEETTAESMAAAPAESSAAQETSSEAVEELVQNAMGSYQYSMDDLVSIFKNLHDVADRVDKSVVSVSSVKTEKDWFDNPVRTSGLFSGIVTAKTDSELLILTTNNAVQGADSLSVTFSGGDTAEASIKRVDGGSGLAVLSVSIKEDNRKLTDRIAPVPLGNSYQVQRGDQLILVGSPEGTVHSVTYGFATYVAKNIAVTDGTAGVIYTDGVGNANDGTWVLNTGGQIIGWVTSAFHKEDGQNPTRILGISDFKSILERMTNGQASPMFGIEGAEVTKELQAQEMPAGIYVTAETNDGPAYKAGIQAGDIITKIGDTKILTMRDYTDQMEKLHAEDTVKVTVMRNGRDQYTPIEFQVTVGAR